MTGPIVDPEAARKLFAGPCDFITGAAGPDQFPPPGAPEIAMIGRSNVGKSSLLNALTGRKNLARISNTPGRTLQINFFDLGGMLRLVDLPGYGYAKIPRAQQEEIGALIHTYLHAQQDLRRVFVLVDARHGLKESDRDMMQMLSACGLPYTLVFTKCDKVKRTALDETAAAAQAELDSFHAVGAVIRTSAEKKTGLEELRAAIAGCAY